MCTPSFKRLAKEIERNRFHTASYATFIHPNPRYYKYYWWVFWQIVHATMENSSATANGCRMPMKQAFELIEKMSRF